VAMNDALLASAEQQQQQRYSAGGVTSAGSATLGGCTPYQTGGNPNSLPEGTPPTPHQQATTAAAVLTQAVSDDPDAVHVRVPAAEPARSEASSPGGESAGSLHGADTSHTNAAGPAVAEAVARESVVPQVAAAAATAVSMQTLHVTVPLGLGPGHSFTLQTPSGATFSVAVPAGAVGGHSIQIQVPAPAPAPAPPPPQPQPPVAIASASTPVVVEAEVVAPWGAGGAQPVGAEVRCPLRPAPSRFHILSF
jgi:hypothetical protein